MMEANGEKKGKGDWEEDGIECYPYILNDVLPEAVILGFLRIEIKEESTDRDIK